VMKNASSKEF